MSPHVQGSVLLFVAFLLRCGVAARWGVTAEEAWHVAVGQAAGGTWFDGALALLPRHPLALRAPGLVLQTVGALLLLPRVSAPRTFAALVAFLPVFALEPIFATPLGVAHGLWALALAGLLHGGWGRALAALAVLLGASLGPSVGSTIVALAALAVVGGRLPRWAWTVVGSGALLAWLTRDAGFAAPSGLLTELLWVGPLLPLAVVAGRGPSSLARWVSVPVLVGSVLAFVVGMPTEAMSLAWWGAAVLVCSQQGTPRRLAEAAAWVGLGTSVLVVVHVERPVVPLPHDPVARLFEAEALADDAVRWALPPGAVRHGARVGEGPTLLTARPEDAASIRYHTGLPAQVWSGCGTSDPLVGSPSSPHALFVRPASEARPCIDDSWVVERVQLSEAYAPDGRRVGQWQWMEIRRLE